MFGRLTPLVFRLFDGGGGANAADGGLRRCSLARLVLGGAKVALGTDLVSENVLLKSSLRGEGGGGRDILSGLLLLDGLSPWRKSGWWARGSPIPLSWGLSGPVLELESKAGFFGTGGAGLRCISVALGCDKGLFSVLYAEAPLSIERDGAFDEVPDWPSGDGVIPVPRRVGGNGGVLFLFPGLLASCDQPTTTQSGSLVGEKGFEGRAGLRTTLFWAGRICERAGRPKTKVNRDYTFNKGFIFIVPWSSHHFRRSELAGGSPAAIEL